jgi:protocatechuate 3,4-dioxygenase beta subunit
VLGELIRSDAREDQQGGPIIVETQFIDFITCKPIPGIWWDMWNANATGVYRGVINEGNGDFTDDSNINNTFLRAVQQANQDGVEEWNHHWRLH